MIIVAIHSRNEYRQTGLPRHYSSISACRNKVKRSKSYEMWFWFILSINHGPSAVSLTQHGAARRLAAVPVLQYARFHIE